MGAPKGNEYWKLRSKDGRDKQYPTPLDLLNACNEYFEWVQSNPLKEEQIVKYKDYYEKVDISKMRPFTIQGLCNYIDLSVEGWRKYKQRNDFVDITTRVEQIIYNQKFEGAASGFLNPNIIARDLGLQDKQVIDATLDNVTKLTTEQRARRIEELKQKLNANGTNR